MDKGTEMKPCSSKPGRLKEYISHKENAESLLLLKDVENGLLDYLSALQSRRDELNVEIEHQQKNEQIKDNNNLEGKEMLYYEKKELLELRKSIDAVKIMIEQSRSLAENNDPNQKQKVKELEKKVKDLMKRRGVHKKVKSETPGLTHLKNVVYHLLNNIIVANDQLLEEIKTENKRLASIEKFLMVLAQNFSQGLTQVKFVREEKERKVSELEAQLRRFELGKLMLEQKDDICQSKEKTDEIRGSFNPKSLKSLHIDKLVRLKELQIQALWNLQESANCTKMEMEDLELLNNEGSSSRILLNKEIDDLWSNWKEEKETLKFRSKIEFESMKANIKKLKEEMNELEEIKSRECHEIIKKDKIITRLQ